MSGYMIMAYYYCFANVKYYDLTMRLSWSDFTVILIKPI